MESLVGQGATLAQALVLLPLVASLPALVSKLKGSVAVATYLGALLLCSLGIWQAFEHSRVLVDGFPSRVVRYAVRELDSASEPNVLVVDGGSYVLNGVDSSTLTRELGELGYRARVVRLAAGGANHFERYRMQEEIVRRLSRTPSPRQQWLYLSEIHMRYDRVPLDQFDKNQDSLRTIDYATPSNAWAAARALSTPGVEPPLGGAYRWSLFRHALVNAFSAGAGLRYQPETDIDIAGGDVSSLRPERLAWRGLGSSLAVLEKPAPAVAPYPWLLDVRDARTKQLWQGYVSRYVYFGLPSTSAGQVEYVRGFCAKIGAPCIAPDDPELIQQLNERKYWRDTAHMMRAGAIIYSRWLAHRLAALGVLRR